MKHTELGDKAKHFPSQKIVTPQRRRKKSNETVGLDHRHAATTAAASAALSAALSAAALAANTASFPTAS